MADNFDQEQAIKDYTRLMEAGPIAENEEELQTLLAQAYAHNLYFDYDRETHAYVLCEPGELEMYLCPHCRQYE